MTEPYRVLVAWDTCASGIWWVSPKEVKEAPTYEKWRRMRIALYGPSGQPPSFRDLLSGELLDHLKAWNDSCDRTMRRTCGESAGGEVAEQWGRELAIQVQEELGAEGWEVFYHWGGLVHRVHPPGSWPWETWRQDLLGYAPRGEKRQQGEPAGSTQGSAANRQQPGADSSTPE